ncbi:MAG: acyl-CoA dehydrogenase family protein [Gammaproteobacteria bacterium]|nr:acyl-CoA dehydrogenase family protein [Gammaproteobacteria bacterium]MCP5424866.1 acyl-CoA dehydrogenase family protein [Gammaproteobacteria bacterium]MCP5458157.1 acyl-CoA dehydrogenase family protein [Gammaproteobacteria bacterium]
MSEQQAGELMRQAREALDAAQKVIAIALASLKDRTQENGKFSAAKLDQYQLVAYDSAMCSAEAAAAQFVLDYAEKAREAVGASYPSSTIEERLGLFFTAEAINSIHARLAARPDDFGISRGKLASLMESNTVQSFRASQLTPAEIAELGKAVSALDGQTGAYLLDDHHEMMQEQFRRFANEIVMPLAKEIHQKDLIIPEEILENVKELGCFGLSIPQQYGGLQDDEQEDNMGMIVVTEELSRGSLGAAGSLITRPEILARALLRGGTEEQKQKWLPQLAAGDPLCAVAVTEPNYGSDVANMRLKATRTEGGWLLNGAKTWCTFGGKAGVLLVLARTNPDLSLGHKGLSMFLAEKPVYDGHEFSYKQEGGGSLSGKAISTIGYRGMHSFEMFFDDFFVPEENMLGGPEGEGNGFYFTMAGFSGGRIQTAARAIGVMQAAYERAVSYSKERAVFGQPIGNYQLTQVKLARMAAYLTASRQFTYAVGRLMDQGGGDMEASMVKLFTCKTAEWFTREALQIHGGMGYAEETPVSRYFIDARVLSIFEGAEETLALKVVAPALIRAAKDKSALEV